MFDVTPASAWQTDYEEGVVLRLPSGHYARLRPVSTEAMLIDEVIPNELLGWVAATFNGKDKTDWTAQSLLENARVIKMFCQEIMVEPRIVDDPNPAKGEIKFSWLSSQDALFVYSWINQPAQALKRFRDEQAVDVEPVDADDGDAPTSE